MFGIFAKGKSVYIRTVQNGAHDNDFRALAKVDHSQFLSWRDKLPEAEDLGARFATAKRLTYLGVVAQPPPQ